MGSEMCIRDSSCADGGGSAPGCRGRSHKVAVDGYKFRYRYQIQIRMQIHMHVQRRTEIQIQLQVHLYQTLFEPQGIGTKYICRHLYINTFRFLDSQGLIRFTKLHENPHSIPENIAPRLLCWDNWILAIRCSVVACGASSRESSPGALTQNAENMSAR